MPSDTPPVPPDQSWLVARMRRHVSELLRLAGPIIVSRMGILVMITADTVMVGRYSAEQLAYQSIGVALIIPVLLSFMGLIMGTIILTSNHFGAENYAECGKVWRRAVPYAIFLGAIACIISLFGNTWLSLTGQTETLSREGGVVMAATGFGLPAHLVFLASAFFLDGIRRPTPAMVLMIIANILNIFLNWLFIYGNFGFSEAGAEGAAWATTGARWFLAIGIVAYIWVMPGHEKFGVRRAPTGGWKSWADQRDLGYAMALSIGVESIAFATLNIFAGWLGEAELAAYSIALNVLAVCFMVAIGLGSAAAVRVGIAFGRRDHSDMMLAGWIGLGVTVVILGIISAVLLMIPETIATFYSADPTIIAATAPMIFFVGFVLVFDGGQATMSNVLRGCRDVWLPSAVQGFSFIGVLIPLAYLLSVHMDVGAIGLLYGILIAGAISVTLLGFRFYWVGKRSIEISRGPSPLKG
jgi:multidrug resistance protein, MATE family